MSGIDAAITACNSLKKAMTTGDVDKVERILNEKVRSPDKHAKGYVKGFWQASRSYSNSKGTPVLTLTTLGDWHCYRIDDPNPQECYEY